MRRRFVSDYPVPVERLARWYASRYAFQRLLPPWWHCKVLLLGVADRNAVPRDQEVAARPILIETGIGRLRTRVTLEQRPRAGSPDFDIEQVQGPFARWQHAHHFTSAESAAPHTTGVIGSRLEEQVELELPWALAEAWFARQLERAFRFRAARAAADLRRLGPGDDRPRRIAISGASGFVGGELCAFLEAGGHRVERLVRRPARLGAREIFWDPGAGQLEGAPLEGLDALVHLSGRSIAAPRWTESVRREILESRVQTTRLLALRLAELERKPSVWVCASAIGFYGNRGDHVVDESSGPGDGFLAEVCRAWEQAANPAREAGIRVVQLRFGLVLSPRGGTLAAMLPVFRAGLAGVLGSGAQWMSWISLDDLIGVIARAVFDDGLSGRVNAVSPYPVTNREFTRTLARVLRRPAWIPVPALAIRAALGEMGEALLLASTRVRPSVLERNDYPFEHPELEDALRFLLGRPRPEAASLYKGPGASQNGAPT